MCVLKFICDKILEALAAFVGLLELFGLKYPVRSYCEQVSESLWRGSRQNRKDFVALRNEGIRTVVSLCAEGDNDAENAKGLGISTIRIPVIDNTLPTQSQIVEFIKIVQDNNKSPVLVHCEAGKGRTGIFVACYRVGAQKCDVEIAIKEAINHGLKLQNQIEFIRDFAEATEMGIIL